ncbi:MAG: D-cysteine desulfhydrase family protein, partial [Deltaproteobacteria bacterium]|nr:D-cysteine desulfhydrase family protein [Deltaproteobacteria bacterium]
MNLAKFPRRGYVQDPTPLEAAPNFSKALGDKVRIYVKRDDLLPGCAGGNKTRKLDFCIADALAKSADTIITCGAVQSNHCRLTLSWARKEGLACHLVLEERVKGSYKAESSGNNFLFQLMDVDSITVVPGGSPMREEMEKLATRLQEQGHKPYIIPGGASNALGALGYVSCVQEIMEQLFHAGLDIHTMIVPSGSAGTHAGIVTGM